MQAVAAPVADARAYVHTQPGAHLDETGWREGRARAWLWSALTDACQAAYTGEQPAPSLLPPRSESHEQLPAAA